jgi:branched-subunit amino acid transport protein AzlD
VLYPVLLLPSALSLAFPSENPLLSRALGATLPVFVLAALSLYTLGKAILAALSTRRPFIRIVRIGVISILSLWQNSQAISRTTHKTTAKTLERLRDGQGDQPNPA